MSYQPERKEKNCLNCGATVAGRYCQKCGQENIISKQNFWSLTKHFVYDIFHFDGKFFDSLRHLLFYPGLIPKEYVEGKRKKYLDPIRMYLFTSAVFFLIFFSIGKNKLFTNTGSRYMTKIERFDAAAKLNKVTDSLKVNLLLDTTKAFAIRQVSPTQNVGDSLTAELNGKTYVLIPEKNFSITDSSNMSDSWLERRIANRLEDQRKKHGDDLNQMTEQLGDEFLHRLPYLLFISLPLFALILKLLYVRRNFYYSDHAVFTLYHYIFSFLLLLLLLGVNELVTLTNWLIFKWLFIGIVILWPLYLFMGLKRFYTQGWIKTFFKFFLIILLGIIMILFLFAAFTFFTLTF